MLKKCRDCQRGFIFFAVEQKYWFEDLGFYVDADCVRCPECRKAEHLVHSVFSRYTQNAHRQDMNDDELAAHMHDLCILIDAGVLKNREKFNWVVSQARKRLQGSEGHSRLEQCLDSK